MYSNSDIAYFQSEFVLLADLCAANGKDVDEVRAAIARRHLPGPPYAAVEFLPANYFELPDAHEFRRTYTGDDLEEVLNAYLDGSYFICLRDATIANIRRKGQLVEEIRWLISDPKPSDAIWQAALHALVDELDELERPFSPDFDRSRGGPPLTRDELVEHVRRRFPRQAAA